MVLGSWELKGDGVAPVACRVAVVALLGVVYSPWSATARQQNPVNALCPVMTQEEVNPEFTTIFEGRVIGFCCDKCLAKFKANPSRYAARVVVREVKSPPIDAEDDQEEEAEKLLGDRQAMEAHGDHAHGDVAAQDINQGEAHDHDPNEDEHSESGDHDHEHGHPQGRGFFAKAIGWLGKFHPPMVNFPIAMILAAALAELLLVATKRSFFVNAGRFCLWVGCVGAVAATVLGWLFGGFHLVDDSWILTTHRWLGTTTAAWSVLLLVVGERTFRRADASPTGYRAMLFIGAALVCVTGFFGGSLIYGLTHYAWS
ncbi:MAG: hypothetical protein IPK83_17890 [Planctomycetes bacterium]|nr:hypothetical protein [Planctomycetota bacterium]